MLRLSAPVLGDDGKVVVDDQGDARQCLFEVVHAHITPDGFLTVDLSTVDRDYQATASEQYQASLSICTDYLRLILPEIPIDERGRVTFTGMLPQDVSDEEPIKPGTPFYIPARATQPAPKIALGGIARAAH